MSGVVQVTLLPTLIYFTLCPSVFIVHFEHVIAIWVMTV